MTFKNQKRTCRYSDCINADENNVCPHHEESDAECRHFCGDRILKDADGEIVGYVPTHNEALNDAQCKCWITCNECRAFCGFEPLSDAEFLKEAPTTVHDVA